MKMAFKGAIGKGGKVAAALNEMPVKGKKGKKKAAGAAKKPMPFARKPQGGSFGYFGA